MSAKIHHAHLTASGYHDGELTIDGQPFPFVIAEFSYDLKPGEEPSITIKMYVDKLTIEHQRATSEGEWVDIDYGRHITRPPTAGTEVRETHTIGQPERQIEYFLERK